MMGMIIMIVVSVVLIGGVGLTVYTLLGKKKEATKEEEKYVPTTQDQFPVDYIRSGIVKLKTGGYRIVIELPSINIDLMEAEEKQVILEQYRQILTSIVFPFQYLQQSRVVDISEYLDTLVKLKFTAKTNFIKSQLEFYSGYLVDLIKNRSILTKKFYFVIPYDEAREQKNKKNYTGKKETKKTKGSTEEKNDVYEEEQRFEKARKQLFNRAIEVERAFRRFEISPHILSDNELLDLFYTSYNKDRSVYQPLKDVDPSDYTSLNVTTKKRGGKNGK